MRSEPGANPSVPWQATTSFGKTDFACLRFSRLPSRGLYLYRSPSRQRRFDTRTADTTNRVIRTRNDPTIFTIGSDACELLDLRKPSLKTALVLRTATQP